MIIERKKDFPRISVIIPTYNRAMLLRECLLSFNQQTYPTDLFEVIVVDDGSSDSTPLIVEKLAEKKLKYHLSYLRQVNSGPAKARNLGIKNAQGKLVAFTDDDCIVSTSWLEQMSRAFSKSDIAGVGGRVLSKERRFFGKYYEFNKILDPEQENGRIIYLVTANACYLKELILAVGGFEEGFRNPGGEDPDLSLKITEGLGYKLIFEPDIVVHHHFDESFQSFFRSRYNYGRGGKLVFKKWGTKFSNPPRNEFLPYHALTGIKNIPLMFANYLIRKRLGIFRSISYSFLDWIGWLYYVKGYKKGY
jgi:glycosyltransferase involved in cell wall biosynthesis